MSCCDKCGQPLPGVNVGTLSRETSASLHRLTVATEKSIADQAAIQSELVAIQRALEHGRKPPNIATDDGITFTD